MLKTGDSVARRRRVELDRKSSLARLTVRERVALRAVDFVPIDRNCGQIAGRRDLGRFQLNLRVRVNRRGFGVLVIPFAERRNVEDIGRAFRQVVEREFRRVVAELFSRGRAADQRVGNAVARSVRYVRPVNRNRFKIASRFQNRSRQFAMRRDDKLGDLRRRVSVPVAVGYDLKGIRGQFAEIIERKAGLVPFQMFRFRLRTTGESVNDRVAGRVRHGVP